MTVSVAIDLALDRLFEYEVPEALKGKLAVGQLLLVPFGHRDARGFAMKLHDGALASAERSYRLKCVKAIVDEVPFFSARLLSLVKHIADYTASPIEVALKTAVPAAVLRPGAREKLELYVSPVADALKRSLPARTRWLCEQLVRLDGGWMRHVCDELKTTAATLRKMEAAGLVAIEKVARRRDPLAMKNILPTKKLPLNQEQAAALETIVRSSRPVLLHGITGSGKTEVYLQAIERELGAGRSSIVLVPEISLTPQTVRRFASRFGGSVAVLHSALSDGERYDEWHRIRSGEARVVVGPRSAVFAPVANLGLIVVDEEHDTSYKQDRSPRYNGRDVAVMRAKLEGAKVVLGSATPSLESWLNVSKCKYAIASMKNRAGAGTLPHVQIVDMSEHGESGKIFSSVLIDALRTKLDRGEQAILFLNRRGYSRSIVCENCAEPIMCPKCSVAYTYHKADDCLRCHVCGGWSPTPAACPSCGSKALSFKGIGTQRAVMALEKIFPRARILRMDADSTSRKQSHDDILGAFRRGEAQILLGTQMIAKGLDFPRVTLVGVLSADISLNMPDFRASERTYQLLAQVSGRAGRAELPGEVYIQTYKPEELAIQCAAHGDFEQFAAEELRVRKDAFFPPYSKLAAVNLAAKEAPLAEAWAQAMRNALAAYSSRQPALVTGDAFPSALEKADDWYRWQIVLRAPSTAIIRDAWKWASASLKIPDSVRVAIDIDAFSLV